MTKAVQLSDSRAWYQANARRYDRHHPGVVGDAAYYSDLARGRRVLEIGAGTGRVTAALAATARLLVAVDNAPAMLEIAARRLNKVAPTPGPTPNAGGGETRSTMVAANSPSPSIGGGSRGVGAAPVLILADARALPLAGPFELAVLAYRIVQHVDQAGRLALFCRLRGLLSPAGGLAFDTWHGHTSRSPRLGPVIVPVDERCIRAELNAAGFESVGVNGGFRGEPCRGSATRVWHATAG